MSKNKNNFFEELKSKSETKLPEGFDERFWKKFDEQYTDKKSFLLIRRFQLWGLPLFAVFLFSIWFYQKPNEYHAINDTLNMQAELSDISEDDFEMALNLETLEAIDLDEDIYPSDIDEWKQLLGGV
ncbi:MAG: hypothetical protein R3A80_01990 [Bdellovibrionota bacterium]